MADAVLEGKQGEQFTDSSVQKENNGETATDDTAEDTAVEETEKADNE